MNRTIQHAGFTNQPLQWKAWLPTVDVAQASAEQLAVLEESNAKARQSDYYLTLVHRPAILRQRSLAYNAIMYAPGGLSRSERELASLVVSRINGCTYCASVHAQRLEQLSKRSELVEQVFNDPATAGDTPREQAIARFAVAHTLAPAGTDAAAIQALRVEGFSDAEVLDLIHVVAMFAWANRLMLNLGEPAAQP
ncbi:MAG: Alkyl hydroperoxide reductase AhpD [Stenotrophomonas maltophilia]|nr:MAG: Alkyl hydroperoxide reductase AhpD [Stenotrophomonas maltophilia]